MKTHFRSLLPHSKQEKGLNFFSSKDDYEEKLLRAQKRLLKLQQQIHKRQLKIIIVFEGHDAAGKGGVIKRLTQYLDPRGFHVASTAKPDAVEAGQHYMQRFFAGFPQPGHITVFDRSWYGRVLVERVEGFCTPAAWQRAYGEINSVEKMLTDDGVIVLKYLLDITHDEQKRRFEERRNSPFKAWKLTEEDLRNRKKWTQYHEAFSDMVAETSLKNAPWKTIAADSKWYARLTVLEDILEKAGR